MRARRFAPLLVATVCLAVASARGTDVSGSWPLATEIFSALGMCTGIALSPLSAWHAARQDLAFLRSSSTGLWNPAVIYAGVPIFWGLLSFTDSSISIAVYTVASHPAPGGAPWFSVFAVDTAWIIFASLVGTALGTLLRRPSLAALTAFANAVLLVIVSRLIQDRWLFPQFVFFTGSGDSLNTRAPSLVVVFVTVCTTLALAVWLAARLFGGMRGLRWSTATPLLILTVSWLSLAVLGPVDAASTHARDAGGSDQECTHISHAASFCSWPEDRVLVDRTDQNWDTFVTTLADAGLTVPP